LSTGQKNKLFENGLSLDSVSKIREAFKEFATPDTYFRLTFDGDPYIEGSANAFNKSTVKTYPLKSFDELLDKGQLPTRALITKFNSKSYGDIESLLQKFRDFLGNSLNVFNSGTKYAEITNSDVNKASAIRFLQKYLGFDFKNIACIGDAANDVCMAEVVSKNGGMSVSMANGTVEMKKASDFVTDDVDSGGFLRFVNEILEINKINGKK
jgi:hydroxymethylpyrimidine pyrophosphatase-like HAD family hydrolase